MSEAADRAATPRLARPDELERVGSLTVQAYLDGGVLGDGAADSYLATLADAADRSARAELYVLTDADGDVVATMTLAPAGGPYAEVAGAGELEMRMLAVAPSQQGRGLASAMVGFAVRQVSARGLAGLVITVIDHNTRALRLYERLGFARQPERDLEPVPGVLLLALTLTVGKAPEPGSARVPQPPE